MDLLRSPTCSASCRSILNPLAIGDIRPGSNDLPRVAFPIGYDRKAILDPDMVSTSVPEAVL